MTANSMSAKLPVAKGLMASRSNAPAIPLTRPLVIETVKWLLQNLNQTLSKRRVGLNRSPGALYDFFAK